MTTPIVLEIDPALFRKRLQLAREAVIAFTRSHCGLVSDAAPCQCHRQVSSDAAASFDETQPLHFGRRSAPPQRRYGGTLSAMI
jgi:hypothetical protein